MTKLWKRYSDYIEKHGMPDYGYDEFGNKIDPIDPNDKGSWIGIILVITLLSSPIWFGILAKFIGFWVVPLFVSILLFAFASIKMYHWLKSLTKDFPAAKDI
jgi:hypothetical protein